MCKLSGWLGRPASATVARQLGLPGELWQIQTELGACCEVQERAKEAADWRGQAAVTLAPLMASIRDEALRDGFNRAPAVAVLATELAARGSSAQLRCVRIPWSLTPLRRVKCNQIRGDTSCYIRRNPDGWSF